MSTKFYLNGAGLQAAVLREDFAWNDNPPYII